MEGFDFPAHGVPIQLFHQLAPGLDRQVGQQFPVNPLPPRRGAALGGADDGEGKRRVGSPLAYRRQHQKTEAAELANDPRAAVLRRLAAIHAVKGYKSLWPSQQRRRVKA